MAHVNVGKTTGKITVLFDGPEFDRFGAYCRKKGFKKSPLIARLIRDYLDEQGFQVAELSLSGSQLAARTGKTR